MYISHGNTDNYVDPRMSRNTSYSSFIKTNLLFGGTKIYHELIGYWAYNERIWNAPWIQERWNLECYTEKYLIGKIFGEAGIKYRDENRVELRKIYIERTLRRIWDWSRLWHCLYLGQIFERICSIMQLLRMVTVT